jgi:hypothetical protein
MVFTMQPLKDGRWETADRNEDSKEEALIPLKSAFFAITDLAANPVDAAFAAECADQEAGQGQTANDDPFTVNQAAGLPQDHDAKKEAEQSAGSAINEHLNEQRPPGAILCGLARAARYLEGLSAGARQQFADARLGHRIMLAATRTAKRDHLGLS